MRESPPSPTSTGSTGTGESFAHTQKRLRRHGRCGGPLCRGGISHEARSRLPDPGDHQLVHVLSMLSGRSGAVPQDGNRFADADRVRQYATLTFLRGALVALAVTLVFGLLGALYSVPALAPFFLEVGLDLRPSAAASHGVRRSLAVPGGHDRRPPLPPGHRRPCRPRRALEASHPGGGVGSRGRRDPLDAPGRLRIRTGVSRLPPRLL